MHPPDFLHLLNACILRPFVKSFLLALHIVIKSCCLQCIVKLLDALVRCRKSIYNLRRILIIGILECRILRSKITVVPCEAECL